MIKAIFFDIDGTLVSFKTHQVPDSTVKSIYLLREKGIKVFIASGRHFLSIDNLGSLQFDGYLTINGGYCMDGNQQVIYKQAFPRKDIDSVVRYMDTVHTFPCIFLHEHALYMNYENEVSREIFQMLNFAQPPLMSLHEAAAGEIFQMVAFFTREEEAKIMECMPNGVAARWHPSFADVIPAGSNKRVGMEKMLAYFGIQREECMAFGDGGNDISMLQYAGIGVAMGNAEDQVKQIADYVTSSVDADGVAQALRYLKII